MKRWDKGSELRIKERLSLRLLFFFAVIHPTFKHAPWKESTIKRSVDDLERFDDQHRKSAGYLIFVITVEWISPVKHRVQKNEECISSEIWEIAVFLYNWLVSPWELPNKLALEKLNRRQQLLDREANPKVICYRRNLWHRAPVQRPTYPKKNKMDCICAKRIMTD